MTIQRLTPVSKFLPPLLYKMHFDVATPLGNTDAYRFLLQRNEKLTRAFYITRLAVSNASKMIPH